MYTYMYICTYCTTLWWNHNYLFISIVKYQNAACHIVFCYILFHVMPCHTTRHDRSLYHASFFYAPLRCSILYQITLHCVRELYDTNIQREIKLTYIHMNLCTFVHVNLHTYIHTYRHAYIHTYIRYVCMYACVHVCTYECMYECMYVCMQKRMYVRMYVWMDVCMYMCV